MEPSDIRYLRSRLGETQAQFGRRFDVSQITVGYWESGRSQPARRRLAELAALSSDASTKPVSTTPFRPIQYLGSKQRLAETIASVVDEVAPGTGRVGDLFAGSGVVSAFLARRRVVTAVDVQAYSQVLTSALLYGQECDFEKLRRSHFFERLKEATDEIEARLSSLLQLESEALQRAAQGDPCCLIELMEYGSIAIHKQRPLRGCPPELSRLLDEAIAGIGQTRMRPGDATATYYFGGPYFAYRQAIALDAMHVAAKSLKDQSLKQHVAAVLLSTASEIVNTVGKQFAQPMRLRKADGDVPPLLLRRALRDRTLDATSVFKAWGNKWSEHSLSSSLKHDVVRGDVVEFVARDRACRAYYADPPYTIDHYSRFYHVLETIVLRDSPRLAEMRKQGAFAVMRGVYRESRHQSLFCVPSLAPDAFHQLFSAAAKRSAPMVMSYSPFDEEAGHRPRLLALKDLVAIASRSYKRVSVMEITEHSHRKLNSKAQNNAIRNDAERLIICEA